MRVQSWLWTLETLCPVLSAAERMVEKSRYVLVRAGLAVGAVLVAISWSPAAAQAHGPINPVASSYLARIQSAPSGVQAKVVDGDLRLWLRVPRGESVVMLDYRGAPYLHFSRGHVWVNENSEMFYLNQTPPQYPPTGLRRSAPPHWVQVGAGDSYEWHDGRLHAPALEAIAPGASYVGPWRIPLTVNGRPAAISGGVWYRGGPSIVWFWPIVVFVLCVVAAWRLHDTRVDEALARAIAGITLLGIMLAAVGRGLHGRPGLSVLGVLELAVITAIVVWAGWRVARNRARGFTFLLILLAALWEGLTLIPTLLHGYVLLAVPAFLGRLAAVVCLGGAIALALPAFRLFDEPQDDEDFTEPTGDEVAHTAA